jgi:hypothetical protein
MVMDGHIIVKVVNRYTDHSHYNALRTEKSVNTKRKTDEELFHSLFLLQVWFFVPLRDEICADLWSGFYSTYVQDQFVPSVFALELGMSQLHVCIC